jgi:hypothetical protein
VLDCSRDRRRAGCGFDACANRRGYPSRNPLPAKRIPADIRSLCRSYTDEAVRSLAAIKRQADAPPRARIQAIAILLDRGWGKAPQPHTGEDGDVRVRIGNINREKVMIVLPRNGVVRRPGSGPVAASQRPCIIISVRLDASVPSTHRGVCPSSRQRLRAFRREPRDVSVSDVAKHFRAIRCHAS